MSGRHIDRLLRPTLRDEDFQSLLLRNSERAAIVEQFQVSGVVVRALHGLGHGPTVEELDTNAGSRETLRWLPLSDLWPWNGTTAL